MTREVIDYILGVMCVFSIVSGLMSVYKVVTWEDHLCSGETVTVEKTDTIRTLSCHVELKHKDEK